ncbi:hypothetical protein O181_042747, partial [Austropuccinia psidii MF-1]|nr:hypothetical protein [Austropuccinia psidii MF-1]
KELRGPRRSSSFLGVVGRFPGISRTTFKGSGEDGEEEEESSVEEEESNGTEGVSDPVGASQGTGTVALALSNQPVSHQSEPSLLAFMQKMTQIMANLQAASTSEESRTQAFKTTFIKAPECFHGNQPFNKWIEPDLSNLTNQYPNYLLNSWILFQWQLFTLFGDPNDVKEPEAYLDSLRVKEGGNLSLYIADFRSFISRIGDWGIRSLIHHFRKRLPSRILDPLASNPSRIDSLQDSMDIKLEFDNRYHEKQKKEIHHQ